MQVINNDEKYKFLFNSKIDENLANFLANELNKKVNCVVKWDDRYIKIIPILFDNLNFHLYSGDDDYYLVIFNNKINVLCDQLDEVIEYIYSSVEHYKRKILKSILKNI